MNHKWILRFLEQARLVSQWSKDPSTQVGCCVVDRDTKTILATGYNGLPRGVQDTDKRLGDRNFKILSTAHAEVNAIYSAARHGHKLAGAWLFSTWPPCSHCSVAIIQAGIVMVVVPKVILPERWEENMANARGLLREAGVGIQVVLQG